MLIAQLKDNVKKNSQKYSYSLVNRTEIKAQNLKNELCNIKYNQNQRDDQVLKDFNNSNDNNVLNVFNVRKLEEELFINQHDIILLGIKPLQLSSLLKDYKFLNNFKGEIISPLAGVTLESLRIVFPMAKSILKIMPSIVVKDEKLPTIGLNFPERLDIDLFIKSHSWFSNIGHIKFLNNDDEFNNLTLVFGSNAAYMASLIAPCIQEMVKLGFKESDAKKYFIDLAVSALNFLQDKDLNSVINQVKTPGGITAAGLNSLLVESNYENAILKMLNASSTRAKEIGEQLSHDLNSSSLHHR